MHASDLSRPSCIEALPWLCPWRSGGPAIALLSRGFADCENAFIDGGSLQGANPRLMPSFLFIHPIHPVVT
jgi:hypothetical protein